MKFEIHGINKILPKNRLLTKQAVKKVLQSAKLGLYIELTFVSNTQMINLQKQFKNKSYPTDVLSFPLSYPEKNFEHLQHFLGEIIICAPQAIKQAKEFGHEFHEEIAALTSHGLSHLMGFDHERSQKESQRQMKVESIILDLAGFNPNLCLISRK